MRVNNDKKIEEYASRLVFTPSRAVASAMRTFERRKNALFRLNWDIKDLDGFLIPMIHGDLVTLLARPGHGKTSTMIHLARRASQVCLDMQRDHSVGFNRFVVYVTYETTVEEFVALLTSRESGQTLEGIARGEADLEKIRDVAVANLGNRIYIIGRSLEDTTGVPITMGLVDDLLRHIGKDGKRPLMVLIDYLQRIPDPYPGMDKRAAVERNVGLVKDLGLNHGCPTVLGCQASRDVDQLEGVKLPKKHHAQWTSAIEQDTDKLIAITRPIEYMEPGFEIVHAETGNKYEVTENLLVVKVQKQRWGKAQGKTFFLFFSPSDIRLAGMAPSEEERF